MQNYVISCCSTADLTREHFERRNINFAYFHYYVDDVEYSDDLGISQSIEDFYNAMRNGSLTRTSQINADEFVEYFSKFLKEGKDVLHVSTSSGISGVYNSAVIARDILAEQFPDRRVIVIDSLCAASGYGMLMDDVADKRDEGLSLDELAEWTENRKKHVKHWFFSSDLTHFVRGGRISKVSGFIGTILKICPLMCVTEDGKLEPKEKHRTTGNAIKAAFGKMVAEAENGTDYNGKCYISHSSCEGDAIKLKDMIEDSFPALKGKVQIMSIGTTIGSHTGPGTVALFFNS